MLRRKRWRDAERFREDMRCFEDLELLLRLRRGYRLRRIPEALVNYYESMGVSEDTTAECDARLILFRRHGYRGLVRKSTGMAQGIQILSAAQNRKLRPEHMAGGLGGLTDPKKNLVGIVRFPGLAATVDENSSIERQRIMPWPVLGTGTARQIAPSLQRDRSILEPKQYSGHDRPLLGQVSWRGRYSRGTRRAINASTASRMLRGSGWAMMQYSSSK